ncbi:MAG TPA: hypothetical protein VGM70_03330 [Pseudolysinimonas sp.]|jgi:hypothetical protein
MIEVGYVSYTVTAERFAQVGADFDAEAIDDAILAELNAKVAPAVEVHRDGKVFADEDSAERAKLINWSELLGEIDIDQLIADHPPRR